MDTLRKHAELLRLLATFVVEAANAEFGPGGWTRAFHDVRFERDGSGWIKRTVILGDQERRVRNLPDEVADVEEELWSRTKRIGGSDWYGLLLMVDATGHCDVKYDYDPACLMRFADDEKAHRPF